MQARFVDVIEDEEEPGCPIALYVELNEMKPGRVGTFLCPRGFWQRRFWEQQIVMKMILPSMSITFISTQLNTGMYNVQLPAWAQRRAHPCIFLSVVVSYHHTKQRKLEPTLKARPCDVDQ
ncbi:MAG: hypothetical protein ABL869_07915, partial [Candidatus Nitrotoga sp.]